MATLYSDIATKQVDPTPKNQASNTEQSPNTKILNPVFTVPSGLTTSDTAYLIKVPKGTTVFATRSKTRASAATAATAATMNVGYYESASTLDADYFATAIDVNAAGEDSFDEAVTYTFTAEGWITAAFATITGAVTAGTTHTFEIVVNYPN